MNSESLFSGGTFDSIRDGGNVYPSKQVASQGKESQTYGEIDDLKVELTKVLRKVENLEEQLSEQKKTNETLQAHAQAEIERSRCVDYYGPISEETSYYSNIFNYRILHHLFTD